MSEPRVRLPEPAWSRGSGPYVVAHPTNYVLRADVRALAVKYLNHPTLRRRISINTYWWHPPLDPPAIIRHYDALSFDVWAWGGRGYPLGEELRKLAFEIIFNDPAPPYIAWIISGGGMWMPDTGWQDAPPGPPGSDPGHWNHIHVTYL